VGHAAEEAEGRDMAIVPGLLVHVQDGASELVAAHGEHEGECVHCALRPAQEILPHAQEAVVHLSLVARWEFRTTDDNLLPRSGRGESPPHVATEGRNGDRGPLIVMEPSPDSCRADTRSQGSTNFIMQRVELREGRSDPTARVQLRMAGVQPGAPSSRWPPAGLEASLLCEIHVFCGPSCGLA
jgi:hypothetical protein